MKFRKKPAEAKAEAKICTLADMIREEQERDKRLN
jgi:hypothetical protein